MQSGSESDDARRQGQFLQAIRDLGLSEQNIVDNGTSIELLFEYIYHFLHKKIIDINFYDNEAIKLAANLPSSKIAMLLVDILVDYGATFENVNTPHKSVRKVLRQKKHQWISFLKDLSELQEPVFGEGSQLSIIQLQISNAADYPAQQHVLDQLRNSHFLFNHFIRYVNNCYSTVFPISYIASSFAVVLSPPSNGHCILLLSDYKLIGLIVWQSNWTAVCECHIHLLCSNVIGKGRVLYHIFDSIAGHPSCIALQALKRSVGFWSRLGFKHYTKCITKKTSEKGKEEEDDDQDEEDEASGEGESDEQKQGREEAQSGRDKWTELGAYFDGLERANRGTHRIGYDMLKCSSSQ